MAGQLTIDTLKASSGVLATQNGMTGIAKAWVSYNGVAQTISASFNVSSVTYNGTGDYTINFTTSMANANYAVTGSANIGTGNYGLILSPNKTTAPTTSAVRVVTSAVDANFYNCAYTYVAILGA
jgi:hypothetical protein